MLPLHPQLRTWQASTQGGSRLTWPEPNDDAPTQRVLRSADFQRITHSAALRDLGAWVLRYRSDNLDEAIVLVERAKAIVERQLAKEADSGDGSNVTPLPNKQRGAGPVRH